MTPVSFRCRSSHSESSAHSFGGFSYCASHSTHASTVLCSSTGSLSQSQAVIERVEEELSSSNELGSLSFPAQCLHVLLKILQYKLLLNPKFFLFVVSTFFTTMAFFISYFFLPSKGFEAGLTMGQAEFLLSIMGITNTIGRILSGWLSDRPWVNTLNLYSGALVCAGVAMLFTPFCTTAKSLAIVSAVFGIYLAISVSLRSILLVEFLGLEQLADSFGLLCLFQGIAALIGAPIAGKLWDMTGEIDSCFYLAGALTTISGQLLFPIKCLSTKSQFKTAALVGSPDLAQECGPITETLTMEQLAASSKV